LDTLSSDGTRNQLGPVKRILESKSFDKFHSVDLSAATDRLPVKLQAQILDALGLRGDLWMKILKRPYYYEGSPRFYSVGQPMGAYSSFAMLALTNHLIMHCALVSSGIIYKDPNSTYAILGDDVVIGPEKLAKAYIHLMNDVLGVVINPIKGFEGGLIEFAKN
jgi:hypothetical protein